MGPPSNTNARTVLSSCQSATPSGPALRPASDISASHSRSGALGAGTVAIVTSRRSTADTPFLLDRSGDSVGHGHTDQVPADFPRRLQPVLPIAHDFARS